MTALNGYVYVKRDTDELEVHLEGWRSYPLGDLRTRDVRPTPRSIARGYGEAIADMDGMIRMIRRKQRTLRRRARKALRS